MYQSPNHYMTSPAVYSAGELQPKEWTGEIGEMDAPLPRSPRSGQLQMKNHLPSEMIEAPVTAEEAYRGSLKGLLNQNVGNFIVATFLVGTQGTTTWEGVLFDVGNDYLTIYQEIRNRYVVGDIYSLKFIEFYDLSGKRPARTVPGGTAGQTR